MDIEKDIFAIISHSGDAKNLFMRAIKYAKEDNFELAKKCIEEGENKLDEAHKKQSRLIKIESSGENINPTVLLIHGQDHLMTAMILKDLAEEFIELYYQMKDIKSEKQESV